MRGSGESELGLGDRWTQTSEYLKALRAKIDSTKPTLFSSSPKPLALAAFELMTFYSCSNASFDKRGWRPASFRCSICSIFKKVEHSARTGAGGVEGKFCQHPALITGLRCDPVGAAFGQLLLAHMQL